MTDAELIKEILERHIPESQTLDFKRDLPAKTDSGKNELRKDVCAFANGTGGVLVFGIGQQDDKNTLCGIADGPDDEICERLQSIVREGITPVIRSCDIRVEKAGEQRVALLHVRRTWNGPHMMVKDASTKFYVRVGTQNRVMEYSEIRGAFLQTEGFATRARNFRLSRLGLIASGDIGLPLVEGAKLVFHVVPLTENQITMPLARDMAERIATMLDAFEDAGTYWRYNLDGVVIPGRETGTGRYRGASQLFRDGAVEVVTTSSNIFREVKTHEWLIDGEASSATLTAAAARIGRLLTELGVLPPFAVMCSLLNVKGHRFKHGGDSGGHLRVPIDRADLLLPEMIVEDPTPAAQIWMRPVLDALWNAGGQPRCALYNTDGKWAGG